FFFMRRRRPPISTLFPYTTLFRSNTFAHRGQYTVMRRGIELQKGKGIALTIPGSYVLGEPHATLLADCSRSALTLARKRGSSKRSEEHTSELQSRFDLVCRLLLEK